MLSHWNYFLLSSAVKKTASSSQAASVFLPTSNHQNILFYNTHKNVLSMLRLLCVPHLRSILYSQSLVSSDGSKEKWSHMLQLHLKLWGSHHLWSRRLLWKWVQGMVTKEKGLPWWLSSKKNLPSNEGNTGLIPGSERPHGKGNGNPLQYFCLGNPEDIEAWWVRVHGVAKEPDTTEWLNHNMIHYFMLFYSTY